jgi:hypothetical protein
MKANVRIAEAVRSRFGDLKSGDRQQFRQLADQ